MITKTVIESAWDLSIRILLLHEGRYTVDHAGPTNFGITLRSLDIDIDGDGDIDADDIRAMTEKDAIAFYRRRWWDQYGYNRIANAMIAMKVFSFAVNMGAFRAHRILQQACRACGSPLKQDGILGPVTIETINRLSGMLPAYRSEAAGFYRLLAATRPEFNKYLIGWLNRAYF